jgi:hypothetical protein
MRRAGIRHHICPDDAERQAPVINVEAMKFESIVWEWPNRAGLEHLRLLASDDGAKAEGLVVAESDLGVTRFRYSMRLRSDWRPSWCGVFVPRGASQKSVLLTHEPEGTWLEGVGADRKPRGDLTDCVALDITNSPFPKTLLTRALALAEGESKTVEVACIDSSSPKVSPIRQQWERLGSDQPGIARYRCTSTLGTSQFDVDEDFFVRFCPGRWRMVSWPSADGLRS